MVTLADPSFLLIGLLFLPLVFAGKTAFLGYSHLDLLGADRAPAFWLHLPKRLALAALAVLVLGMARPQWRSAVAQERFLARDIIIVMDLSYSMENDLGQAGGPRKIDVAKKAAVQFIQKRKNDRIGLLVFGDETYGSWPLTRDLALISKKVDRLGSTFYGGTNLAQPLLKAMDHFREMGQSANRVVVFLSDGEARIASEMKEKIVKEMRKMDIHFYLLGIQLRRENSDILEVVHRTGGRYIPAESARELALAFGEIDRLEPSVVHVEVERENRELYPLFAFLALGLISMVTFVRNTLFIELC